MYKWVGRKIGGSYKHQPDQLSSSLSAKALEYVTEVYEGLDASQIVDYHTHIVGRGDEGTGCTLNKRFVSSNSPMIRIKAEAYLSAAGITDLSVTNGDRIFVERLNSCIENIPNHGKHAILAFDSHYSDQGTYSPINTEFHTPTEYILDLVKEFPQYYYPTCSVHPYRSDAISSLKSYAKQGVRLIKWLPNAMNINPADPRCEPFYKVMKKYSMVLLSHSGEEKAVHAEEFQRMGNPLLLRSALSHGVKVIIAHCASLGKNPDLDHPGEKKPMVPNFQLFIRLMEESEWEGLLFADISATTFFSRCSVLETIIRRKEWHNRIVNGSDYPLPAVNLLIQSGVLMRKGLLEKGCKKELNEIWNYNPLLFDFVIKRMIRVVDKETGETLKLPDSVFLKNEELGLFLDDEEEEEGGKKKNKKKKEKVEESEEEGEDEESLSNEEGEKGKEKIIEKREHKPVEEEESEEESEEEEDKIESKTSKQNNTDKAPKNKNTNKDTSEQDNIKSEQNQQNQQSKKQEQTSEEEEETNEEEEEESEEGESD